MATKKEITKATAPENKEEAPKVRYNTLMLQEQGAKYKTLFTEKYKNRTKWEQPDRRKIFSLIPGTILDIFVKEGQEVKAGDVMLTLEAMKMKNKIEFPIDGVVKSVNVKVDQKIPKGYLMIELK